MSQPSPWLQRALVTVSVMAGLALGGSAGHVLRPEPPPAPEVVTNEGLSDLDRKLISESAPVTTFFMLPPKGQAPPRPVGVGLPELPGLPAPKKDDVATGTLRLDFAPAHFALTPDGRHLLLANAESDRVVAWDWERDQEERRIPVGSGPCYVLVRGKSAYVCNGKGSTLSEIDLESWKVVRTITLAAGQPYYASATPDPRAPIFVTCGPYSARVVLRVDLATEKSETLFKDYVSVFTVHASGRVAIKQSEFGHSPSGSPTVLAMNGGALGNPISYQHESFGLLASDRKGKYWLGAGGVWDAGLAKQVVKLDAAQLVAEDPTGAAVVAVGTGNGWDDRGQGSIAFYDLVNFGKQFSRSFALPPGRGNDNGYRVGLTQPVCVSGAAGTNVLFLHRGNVVRVFVPATALPVSVETRLRTPLPTRLRAGGPPWSFKLELDPPRENVTFKAIELPPGCELDPRTGVLTWSALTKGEYEIAVRAFVGSEEQLKVEEHVSVEGDASPPPLSAPPAAPAKSALGWDEYRSPDGEFAVRFPAGPVASTRTVKDHVLGVLTASTPTAVYTVSSYEVPARLAKARPAEVLADATETIRQTSGGVPRQKRDAPLDGLPGVEQSFDLQREGKTIKARVVLVGKRVYLVEVRHGLKDAKSVVVEFLDSFAPKH